MTLVLASTSASRQAMLRGAGVAFEAVAPNVDEDEIKRAMVAAGARARDVADALAEAKAVKVSRRLPGALVLGSDQILECADGTLLDKPEGRAGAAAHLRRLMGAEHRLVCGAVIALDGVAVWRVVDTARLVMRPLSDAFIADYLDREGDAVLGSVGAYRIEALGAQLFGRIDGDHFTVMGLPLLPVLDFLRVRGVLAS
ncbi:Maf family protein [Glacieibacterium frigidum]|uniref:Nucleoside triphosphate pyrophosphatase n=1 Tax=Glacieibacterium frigidum TaxID=2593303 RepID=A0A552UA30_9SPHN|nr:Maf family protein [Glacieibacterium frigidum]TRW15070.1 septum formation protein Maf [Glacieibacterium frigidum]